MRHAALSLLFCAMGVGAFQNPSETPASPSALAPHTPLLGVARAGQRIVAVGSRGHVVYSDDEGRTWKQASVPVSTDLVAVSFPSARKGWAVGHGGVVLQTSDAGATWALQLDGKRAAEIAIAYYQSKVAQTPSAELKRIHDQAKAVAEDGSTRAFLDVYFDSETSGFVVGTFNRIFRTEDGGKTWTPWMDRTSNPREINFYSIRGDGRRVLLTGEQGMVWQLDAQRQVFDPRPTPYKGTLFGSFTSGTNIFVYGMRGSVFRSGDDGRNWEKVEVPSAAGISGGVVLEGGKVMLASQAGTALVSADGGQSFKSVQLAHPMSYFGIGAASAGKVTMVGSNGVKVEALP